MKSIYRSGFEEKIAKNLIKSGVRFGYESVKIPYVINPKTYKPDFVLTKKDCSYMYIEAKGYFKASDRAKMLAVKRSNPDKDIRLLFMQDNTLSKKSKTTYSKWAEKNGFPYHVGESVPKKWLQE